MDISFKLKGIDKPVELHAKKADDLLETVEKLGSYIGDELFDMIRNGNGGKGDYLDLCNKLGEAFATKMSISVYVNATKEQDLKGAMESGNTPFIHTHFLESILGKATL